MRKYDRLKKCESVEDILTQAAHVIDHMSEVAATTNNVDGMREAAELWMELAKFFFEVAPEGEAQEHSEITSEVEAAEQDDRPPMGFRMDK